MSQNWIRLKLLEIYSKRPKSGRPDFGVFEKRPAFRQRLKSGRKRPVIGRTVLFNLDIWLSDVRFQLDSNGRLIAETCSKPVWNRMSGYRTFEIK